jgi:hypothetical protein
MPIFNPEFYLPPLGKENRSTIYVKNLSGQWVKFPNFSYFKIKKMENQINYFEIEMYDIGNDEKNYVKEFIDVLFFSSFDLPLKGRIQNITYSTGKDALLKGFGEEVNILDEEFEKKDNTTAYWSDIKRAQYTNTSVRTILKELLSVNSDGNAPYLLEPSTSGIFASDYGNISIRFEYANRLKAINEIAEAIGYEWGTSTQLLNPPYPSKLEFAPLLPSDTRATVSQQTFRISSPNANCSQTRKETDITNLANKIDLIGAGDGINQLRTSTYNASPTFSTLASDITSSSATITLADASSFPSSGEIRIMEERVTYSGKSGNDLTGCSRGASGTTPLSHKRKVYVEKYVPIDNPESGSSIYDVAQIKGAGKGVLDYSIVKKNIVDLTTLELIASTELLKRMEPIIKITIVPNEPRTVLKERKVGDLISVVDEGAGISDDYRINSIIYESNYGDINIVLEASNRSLTFIEQMEKQREELDNLQRYAQGATNIYLSSGQENCDATHYFNLRFFIPNEAIAINEIKLNFKFLPFTVYTGNIIDSGSHDHRINISDEPSGDIISVGFQSGNFVSGRGAITPDPDTDNEVHSHTIPLGIVEEPLTGQSVNVYSGEDGGAMTFKGTYTTNQTEINLTSEVADVGKGKWFNIQFRPNKRMRIDANTYIQIFIGSN